MLTTRCPNSCEWCFARAKMGEYRARGIEEMSWEDFLAVVSYYEQAGLNHMILLGGEPTLHTRFEDILVFLESRNFSSLVVTNGICDKELVDALAQKKIPRTSFSVNTTAYFRYPAETRERVDYFLRSINHPVMLAYTLTAKDVEGKSIHPLLDRIGMIMKFGLVRHIQFQIAVPGQQNSSFVPFGDCGNAIRLLDSWFKILRKNGISAALDCQCIPKCLIKDIGEIGFEVRSQCSGFMIDIGPALEVWPCFPLSGQSLPLKRFRNFDEIKTFFSKINAQDNLYYDESCSECSERARGACDAGCRGFQILRKRDQYSNTSFLHQPAVACNIFSC